MPSATQGQDRTASRLSIPAELLPVDQEIRELLGVGDDSCKAANPDAWVEKVQKALQIAESRELVGDRAVVEALLASASIMQGNIDQAFIIFRKALQDSIDAKREILEADILVSLASEGQLKGNTQEAVDLVTSAVSLSEKTANLYGKARALGELGRLRMLLGKYDEASSLIDEALNIDRLNGYKFESLHLVYRASYLGVIGKEDQAIESLERARAKAVEAKDTYSFILAENAYAFGLARKGKVDEAKREMELVRAGELTEFVRNAKDRDCLSSSLALPVFHIIFLEGFTNVLEAANQKEEEIQIWDELFSTSLKLGLLAAEAEAKQKVADLENQLKKTDEALKNYALAAELYKKLGNEALLSQVQVSESLLLVNSGHGKEAVPLVGEVASYAKRNNLRELEFRAYITLGGIYQQTGETRKARDALEKAISIVHPGPFDDQIDNQAVHLAYVSLSDIYRTLAIPTRELISIERAFSVSLHLKDEKAQEREVGYLDQRLRDLRAQDLANERQKEGQLVESLAYSYVLDMRYGHADKSAENPNWQRILTLPFQITQEPGGASQLVEILQDVGPMLAIEKLPLLDAIAQYYVAVGADPVLAEKYATEAENLLSGFKGDQGVLKVRSTCILAISYSRQGKNVPAREKSAECLKLSEKTHDDQTITYAEAVDAMVQAQTGNIAATRSSLEKLIVKAPDNAELLVELAMSLASAKLYTEANSQLDSAVRKFLSTGDKKTAAGAYARTAIALNSDSSDIAKKFRLEYLNAARRLYHELGADAEEAGALIVIGDYFVEAARSKTAIENYRTAHELARKSGQRNIVAQALLGLGNAYQADKDFVKAKDFHEKAAELFHELNNSVGETIALRNIGRDSYEVGDLDRVLSALLDARKAAANTGTFNKYLAAYLLGDFYRSQAQYEKAFASFREAVDITTREGDIEHCGYSHLAIASTDGLVGNWDDAITESENALSLFEKIGNKEGQANSWAELTGIYSDRTSSVKDFAKAEECYRKALDLGHGKILDLDLMEIHLQTGKYSEAARIAKDRIQDCLKDKDTSCRAHALISLSEAERLDGNFRDSRAALNEARPLVSRSPELYLRGRLIYQESRLLASEGRLNDAFTSYQRLISLLESIKGKLDAQEQKSISENYGFIYDELVSLLYSMSKKTPKDQFKLASESLEYAEKNKARQFADTWGRVFKNQMRQALEPAVQEREQALSTKRDGLMAKIEAASDSGEPDRKGSKASLETELASVETEIARFVLDLRKASPQYAAVAYPEDIQISTLPLRKGETLIEFKMTEDSTFVWIVRNPDGTRNELAAFYEIRKKRTWFYERLSKLRNALNLGNPEAVDWKISEELFAALFPREAGQVIQDSQEIIFIPDDVLFVLPFELFSPSASKGDFPFLTKATTYYPSAVSLRLRRTANHSSRWQSALLGIADPITSSEDERFELAQALKNPEKNPSAGKTEIKDDGQASHPERLKSRGFTFERIRGTAAELQMIAGLLKERNQPVDVRYGVNATKAELLDTDLGKFRFVHFATHGVLPVDAGIPEPSLVLSYGPKPEDMFLSMSEILKLKLQSESVVLSACNTGSGKISKAEGVMSLGRAFLASGSASVTVSLWQVSDESTAVLMAKYYQGLLEGKKKSLALAEARYAVFASGSKNPFFWAPFIVIGE